MQTLTDYELRDPIHESRRTIVYRGRRRSDDRAVIVKTHRADRPQPAAIARLRHEYGVGVALSGPSIIEYLAVEAQGHSVAVVTEDFGGVDLRALMPSLRGDLEAFLAMALQLTEALALVHERGVAHRDLKPANVVVNPETGVVKLIDFGLASNIVRERRDPTSPATMVGTLAYMSPEQTGRTNRPIDHRTDFYSLGITFYEVLCGQPPFTSSDPLELIHSHIAKQVVPPHQLDGRIPVVLSEVVGKLLAKNAEDRYQTARGLQADLLRCQQALRGAGPSETFVLGAHDRAQTLQLSQRMYGRGPQRERLLAAFERVAAGSRELALVRGSAGIGKSSLVAEVHRPMTRARGYVIRGKCDPLQRNTPYTSLIEAFRSLLRELLTESETRLVRWRERLDEALGANAPILAEVLPELRLFLGEQPMPTEVGPAEARRRFDRTFLRLVGAFAHREHPLVVILDDLQWVDSATLRILSQVLGNHDCAHLLVVGAYRSEEVDAAHPLVTTMVGLREAGVRSDELELGELELSDVTAWVADTLGCTTDAAYPLAALVHGKTGGNPFFIGELLHALHDGGLLTLDTEGWTWDLAAIEAHGVSTSVVALLVDKVRLLPDATQQILRIAACMGNVFSLGLLCQVLDRPLDGVAHGLQEAVGAGLVQPLDDLYQQANLGMSGGEAACYRFTHDRIQEAAYSLLPAPERPAVHWRVGQLLLERTPPAEREAHVFEIVNQLVHTVALERPPAERVELARLDLLAGERAAAAAAHEQALVYLRRGIELLGDDAFDSELTLALQLHIGACGSAQLSGELDAMDRFAEVALAKAPSALDRVPIHEIRIRAHCAQGHLLEALALGREVLASFGIHLPKEAGLPEFQQEMEALVAKLAGRETDELAKRPPMEDAAMRAMMRVLVSISAATFTTTPMLYPAITRRLIELTLEHGNAPESAVGYVQYGMLCCSVLGDYQAGQRYVDLAETIVDRLAARWILPRVVVLAALIRPWAGPLQATCEQLRDCYREGMDNGDPEWAGHCIQIYGQYTLFGSFELGPLLEEVNAYVDALDRAGQQSSVIWMKTYLQMTHNLLGHAQAPTRLRGEAYDELEMIPIHEAHGDLVSLLHVNLATTILSYLFRDYERGLDYAGRTEAFMPAAAGQIFVPLYHFYDSLVRLAVVVDGAPDSQREELLTRVEANQAKLEVWARSAPSNYAHKWTLVEAERHRVAGRLAEAIDAYDEAIALATRHGYINEAALANERAAELWRARGHATFARSYASAAHYDYARWGARAKLADLEARYPELTRVDSGPSESSSMGSEPLSDSEWLDMGSVFKATRIISEEMDLQSAVTKLMTIVIENAGARRGLLLLEEAGALQIQAAGSVADDAVVVEHPPSEQSGAVGSFLSEAIVRFVSRTREPVVLHDAPREGPFTRDPHVLRTGVRSVLCMPFSTPTMDQRAATGVLYLENADAVGAFTHDRVHVLKLITAQAAISLENARLYGDLKSINARLEELVEERTRELRQAQQALIRASRKAGQAEVAENLLHNAGNTLNRLTVAMGALQGAVELPAARVLRQAVARIGTPDHELLSQARGPLLLKLLTSISKQLDGDKDHLSELANGMSTQFDEFVQVLKQHDQLVEASMVLESFPLGPLLDDAIASADTAAQPGLALVRRYGPDPVVHSDRYRLERLVVGLLRDLHERADGTEATLTVDSQRIEGRVQITVGLGELSSKDRELDVESFRQRRFSHPEAPTLHDCAIAAGSLGAVLAAFVGRSRRDAHFVLTLDVQQPDRTA
ncbi:AAA family ATPase [Paraliomyxa miuraensis]|uniref:AAA family ATPase n=1 Tax=Paraliomyxa miuraensis TaxID=376150 RepID=UPI00225B5B0C|nr:AAA family ATPase [Paraliomyxa miuraensis]MCX4247851.1 AAA family ATPase [Paraliomyxa miuraensis]